MLSFHRTRLAAALASVFVLTTAIGQTASTPQPPAPPAKAHPQAKARPQGKGHLRAKGQVQVKGHLQAKAPTQAPAQALAPAPAPPPFTFATVQRFAQERAAHAYRIRSTPLPRELADLNYEQYSEIQFRQSAALWHNQSMFEVQFFHRGFNFDRRVNIYEVQPSGVRALAYYPSLFTFGRDVPRVALPANLGFAGLAVHYPLNTPGFKDEVIAFLGASYFRALGRNAGYGVSARGLAIDTATTAGEEFPYFTDFWLVQPQPNQRSMTIYALLDSPSIAGAYEFDVRPGTISQVLVSGVLYARQTVDKLGIAPLTSMFLYGEGTTRGRFDDWRPEVHNSDGLMMQTGTGEWLWRPLENPDKLQVNRFMDENPEGFRPHPARPRLRRLPGSGLAIRAAAELLDPAARRLGQGRHRAGRDPERRGNPRQYRRLLGAERSSDAACAVPLLLFAFGLPGLGPPLASRRGGDRDAFRARHEWRHPGVRHATCSS